MKSYIEADFSERWRPALNRKSRPIRTIFEVGDAVAFCRQEEKGAPDAKWHGPGRVLQPDGSSGVWVTFQGGLCKCSPEHVRHSTREEMQALRFVPEDIQRLEEDLSELRSRRTYVDLTAQEPPQQLGEVPDELRGHDPDLVMRTEERNLDDHLLEVPLPEAEVKTPVV